MGEEGLTHEEGGAAVVAEEPAVEETAGVPDDVQKAIDDGVDRAVDKAVELALAKVEELLNGRLEGVSAAIAEHRAAIEAELEQLAESGLHKAEQALEAPAEDMLTWAHQRIDGLVTAVERALGINVSATLPRAPGEAAETHTVEVTGAETAGDLG